MVHGGVSGVSLSAVQLCKAFDSHVTVTCTSAGAEVLHRLQADDTIDIEADDLEAALSERDKSVFF